MSAPSRRTLPCVALFVAIALVTLPGYTAAGPVPALTRGAIHIASNLDFTPVNGVVGGLGTAQSPYVISGWIVDPGMVPTPGGTTAAVQIEGTTAFFVISNVTIQDENPYDTGLLLSNVQNATVTNTVINDFRHSVKVVHVADLAVRGVTVRMGEIGQRQGGTGSDLAFEVSDSVRVLLNGTTLVGPPAGALQGDGLKVENSQDVLVKGTVVNGTKTSFDHAVWVNGGTRVNVTDSHIVGVQGVALMAIGGDSVQIVANELTGDGMAIRADGTHLLVAGNRVMDDAAGIEVSGNHTAVRDNDVERTRSDRGAVYMTGSDLSATGNRLVGNGENAAGSTTLFLVSSDRAEVRDNNVSANRETGVGIAAPVADTARNVLEDNPGTALFMDGRAITMSGDTVARTQGERDPRYAAVAIRVDFANVSGLSLLDNVGSGLRLQAHQAITILNLTAERNDGAGASLENAMTIVLRGCTVRSNTGKGIFMSGDFESGRTPAVTLEHCDISDNAGGNLVTSFPSGPTVITNGAAPTMSGDHEVGPHSSPNPPVGPLLVGLVAGVVALRHRASRP
ncbi:MAG: right-handed parallel beta-helix repeat-containing protein [Thermoplasmatota archaeon]